MRGVLILLLAALGLAACTDSRLAVYPDARSHDSRTASGAPPEREFGMVDADGGPSSGEGFNR